MTEKQYIYECNISAVIVSKLSIERCQGYLAHLHALIYLYEESHHDSLVTESLLQVMKSMRRELEHSSQALETFG